MKLIIDIPDNEYKHIREYYEKNDIVEATYSYIYNGTPLPKGHGRLIDADELSKRLVNSSMFYSGETADMFDTRFADGLREADIKLSEAQVVIESDKGE